MIASIYLYGYFVFIAEEIHNEIFGMAGYGTANKLFRRSFLRHEKLSFQAMCQAEGMPIAVRALANAGRIAVVEGLQYIYRLRACAVGDKGDGCIPAWSTDALFALKAKLVTAGRYEKYKASFIRMVLELFESYIWKCSICGRLKVLGAVYSQMRETFIRLVGREMDIGVVPEFTSSEMSILQTIVKEKDPQPVLAMIGQDLKTGMFALKNTRPLADLFRSKVATAPRDVQLLRKQLSRAKIEIARLTSSTAYRTGMFVTWPLRKTYRFTRHVIRR